MHAKTHTDTHTQAPKKLRGFGSQALTSGFQSKGCCSPVYNSTTDPLCSSCKFCSFSSGLRGALCCFVKRRRRQGEAREQRSEATICVRTLNHCVCMKAGIVHVWRVTLNSACEHKKSSEDKEPLVWDENIVQCYRLDKINWSNGHTYFHYSALLRQAGENRLATTSGPVAMMS